MDKNTYQIDLKIYDSIPGSYFTFFLPQACFSGENTRPGYYTFDIMVTADELQEFEFAVKNQQGASMKVIGVTQTSF